MLTKSKKVLFCGFFKLNNTFPKFHPDEMKFSENNYVRFSSTD